MKKATLKKLVEDSFQKVDNIFQFKNEVLELIEEYYNDNQITININKLNPDIDVQSLLAKHGEDACAIMTQLFNKKQVHFPLPDTARNKSNSKQPVHNSEEVTKNWETINQNEYNKIRIS